MIKPSDNYPLKQLNTFGLDVKAAKYVDYNDPDELIQWLSASGDIPEQVLPVGRGSNLLFTKDYQGLVLHNTCQSIVKTGAADGFSFVKVAAGVEWDHLVAWSLNEGLFGLENLSLIPGTVGACPVQNIGAYGVEVSSFIHAVEGFSLTSHHPFYFHQSECRFSYRHSIFKESGYHDHLITWVHFKFNEAYKPSLEYADLKRVFQEDKHPRPLKIREAVINIRKAKLPDPEEVGNAGSFFKNPEVAPEFLYQLKKEQPDIRYFESQNDLFKISAAWLIEHAGFKGYRNGDSGTFHTQPLVLVNYGKATGLEILELAQKIEEAIQSRFGIRLQPEVRIL